MREKHSKNIQPTYSLESAKSGAWEWEGMEGKQEKKIDVYITLCFTKDVSFFLHFVK